MSNISMKSSFELPIVETVSVYLIRCWAQNHPYIPTYQSKVVNAPTIKRYRLQTVNCATDKIQRERFYHLQQ